MNIGKFFGSVMLIVGTTLGAGMLGMPTAGAGAGFVWSAVVMLVLWLVSICMGFLLIEVNLALPVTHCSYSSMAKETLGVVGKAITWGMYLFLLYVILVAYIIGGASLIINTLNVVFGITIPYRLGAVLFTIILGMAVFWSSQLVDYFNRFCLGIKGLLLFATLALVVPYIDVGKLLGTTEHFIRVKYIWTTIPLFLTAFCYHFIIPSLRIYVGDNVRQLKAIVVIGASISSLIYIWWLAVAFGVIPVFGEHSFAVMEAPPAGPIQSLAALVPNSLVVASVRGFSNVALTTSFLGVSLGLFDFLADGFSIANTRLGRFKTASLTFVPPFLFAIFSPQGFSKALNYAAISVTFLTIILPSLMAYVLRRKQILQSPYRVPCNNAVLIGFVLSGIVIAVLALLYILDFLPKITQ